MTNREGGLVSLVDLPTVPSRGKGRPRKSFDSLPDISVTPDAPANLKSLLSIRHSHHHLAQLLAAGELNQNEISLITGYCPSRISILKRDPLFRQLMETYAENRRAIFVDALERMKNLGLSSLDELQRRLEEDPEKFTRRELMEMSKILLSEPKGSGVGGNGNSSSPNIALNVKFVSPSQPQIALEEGVVRSGEKLVSRVDFIDLDSEN